MKININQLELQNALSIVAKGVSTQSTLPVLSGIHIKASQDSLIFQSTDLEISIQYETAALVEEEGETVVPGKLLLEIVKSLPDATVLLETSDDSIIIMCDSSSFSLKTLNPLDFPSFPQVEASESAEIPVSEFTSMIKKVARVVSKDESRAILSGVLVSVEEDTLKMVATDSYRLAVCESSIQGYKGDEFEAVISGSFLQEIASIPRSAEYINLALSDNQIVVKYGSIIFINRRIEGKFPNYKQLLPSSYSTRAHIDVKSLTESVKRVSLLNKVSTPIRFNFDTGSQILQISTSAQDIGTAQESISCQIEEEENEIAFNYAYVLDGLSAISTSGVYIEIQNSMKPGIFKSEEDENFLYLIMPVRIT